MKFRIREASDGSYRVQYKRFFLDSWYTSIRVFKTDDEAHKWIKSEIIYYEEIKATKNVKLGNIVDEVNWKG